MMKIIVTNLSGEEVDTINTSATTLQRDIEKVKEKYPIGQFHAKLQTY